MIQFWLEHGRVWAIHHPTETAAIVLIVAGVWLAWTVGANARTAFRFPGRYR